MTAIVLESIIKVVGIGGYRIRFPLLVTTDRRCGDGTGVISVSGNNQSSAEAVHGQFAQFVMNTDDVIEADVAT
jgi:hypothetical protein